MERWSLLWDLWSLFRGTRGRRARLGCRRGRRLHGEVGKGRRRLARAGGVSRVVDYESGEARGLELHARVVDAVCAGARELYLLRRRVLVQNGGCTGRPKNCFTLLNGFSSLRKPFALCKFQLMFFSNDSEV